MVYTEICTRRYRHRHAEGSCFTLQIKFKGPFILNPERIKIIIAELERAAEAVDWSFVLDFEDVRMASTRLLEQLIPACKKCKNRHFILVPVCNVRTEVREVIRMSGLGAVTKEVPYAAGALLHLDAINKPELLRTVG